MRNIVIAIIYSGLAASSAFASQTFQCTKTDQSGANTEALVLRQSCTPGAEVGQQSSRDGSYQVGFDCSSSRASVGLLAPGSFISQLKAVGDAKSGVAIIALQSQGQVSVDCKLVSQQ